MTMWPVRATVGLPALRCTCKRRRAYMLDRRHFLIGAGALLTASFVKRAKAFSRKSGEPLVLSPARKPDETLYVYWQRRGSFLSVTPIRRKKRLIIEVSALTPRSDKSRS